MAFSDDAPKALITGGPYRIVRHPFYAAYLLYWLAGWIATGNWFVAGTSVLAAALCVDAACREERKFMASPLSSAYEDYRADTGMFFPSLRK